MLTEAKHPSSEARPLSGEAKHLGPIYVGLALLSSAALAFEITLTRLFSVTQWYHFAFLAVSVALLGYGASGTALSLAPRWAVPPAGRRAARRVVVAPPGRAARLYAANLFGSALGGLAPVALLPLAGEGTVLIIAALGLLAALVFQGS